MKLFLSKFLVQNNRFQLKSKGGAEGGADGSAARADESPRPPQGLPGAREGCGRETSAGSTAAPGAETRVGTRWNVGWWAAGAGAGIATGTGAADAGAGAGEGAGAS